MRHFVVLAVVSLLLHGYLVEGATTPAPTTAAVSGTPAGSATTCFACSTNDSTDACATGTTGSGSGCAFGVCIVELEEDADGNVVTFERKCHDQACNSDNENSVFSEAITSGGIHYEECCADAVDCNAITYTDLKSTAGKLTAGMAATLFGAICLLVL
ncbi:uncharacterized protein LOC118429345 [Branchiostoma floridae]|uniref:Uncharacterized protein LOC118429345 n=1 Tax=Branchiostoma floridae TaxID=7739 RepID=A0A9J7N9I4_BRAFL|nr:uncharacterized protein LOC118429345 [Branchiostoma floridae]